MRIKKIIYFFGLLLIADLLIIACCDCKDMYNYKYTHTGLSLRNLDYSGDTLAIAADDAIINKNAFGIDLQFIRENKGYMEEKTYTQSTSFLFSKAYAFHCDCGASYGIPEDILKEIHVFTLQDFDDEHPTNSEITDYFKVYTTPLESLISIQEAIDNMDYLIRGWIGTDDYTFDPIKLLLMKTPVYNTKHAFKVQVMLSDGRVLEKEIKTELSHD